eukprot:jgi/Mesen1/10368/ME000080S09760
MVERFIREARFLMDLHKSSKQQSRFPAAHAPCMELRLSVPKLEKAYLSMWGGFVQAEEEADTIYSVVCQADPGNFCACNGLAQACRGLLEVVSIAKQREGNLALTSGMISVVFVELSLDTRKSTEHVKSDCHKHILKRKMEDLPPLGHAEYAADSEIEESVGNNDEYLNG